MSYYVVSYYSDGGASNGRYPKDIEPFVGRVIDEDTKAKLITIAQKNGWIISSNLDGDVLFSIVHTNGDGWNAEFVRESIVISEVKPLESYMEQLGELLDKLSSDEVRLVVESSYNLARVLRFGNMSEDAVIKMILNAMFEFSFIEDDRSIVISKKNIIRALIKMYKWMTEVFDQKGAIYREYSMSQKSVKGRVGTTIAISERDGQLLINFEVRWFDEYQAYHESSVLIVIENK